MLGLGGQHSSKSSRIDQFRQHSVGNGGGELEIARRTSGCEAGTLLRASRSMLRGLFTHRPAEEFGERRIEGGAGLLFDLF